MARPLRVEFPGAVYHVMARGNERRRVFRDDRDREHYLERLAHYRERFGFRIYAFCLMDNHVHLALEAGPEPLSRLMLSLQGSYTQWFNRRHRRVGHLFQGRYKAILVDKNSYLLALVRYIHDNPVKAGTVAAPSRYRWSSDRYYREGRGPGWIDIDEVLGLLGRDRTAALKSYRMLMVQEAEPSYDELPTRAQIVKGDEAFAVRILRLTREPEAIRRSLSVGTVARFVARRAGVDLSALKSPRRFRELSRTRAIVAYLAKTLGRIPFSQTAEYFNRDGSTLVKNVARLEHAIQESKGLRNRIATFAKQLPVAMPRSTGKPGPPGRKRSGVVPRAAGAK